MGLIEQITEMKTQGTPDEQIISSLQQQGISPKQINDALSQAQVKSAVTGSENSMEPGMQPSIMEAPAPQAQTYQPQTQEVPGNAQEYGQDPYATAEYGADQGYYAPQSGGGGTSTDTMIEIAEQVFAEKISAMRKKVEDVTEFKTISNTKIENMERRLKKVEDVIDQIHNAVLEKVSAYGKEILPIKKEMEMMQDSFSKMVNPLASRAPRKRSTKKRKSSSKKKSTKRKKSKKK